MPLPNKLVYNDLSGDEIKHILMERFAALLGNVPYLQAHITLPRLKMSLSVDLDCYADQNEPERKTITDTLEITSETFHLKAEVDASSKGKPPDQVREEHGLGVPTPKRSPLGPLEDTVEGRVTTLPNGATVDRTGQNPKARAGSTFVEQDFGPRLTRQNVARPQGRDGVPSPNFEEFGK